MPSLEIEIREYNPARDAEGVRACFIALQDHEHDFAPEAPAGMGLVDQYVPFLLNRVGASGGRIFVAERKGRIVGFVSAVIVQREEPDDIDTFHVDLAELSVLPPDRGQGVGGRLLQAAEHFARSVGAPSLRIRVDARNNGARRMYGRNGFSESVIGLKKRLTGLAAGTSGPPK